MKNFVQPGNVLDLVAPAGGVVSGMPVVIGSIFAVPQVDAMDGDVFAGVVEGVVLLPKAATIAPAQGTPMFWDAVALSATSTSAAGLYPIGVCTAQASAADIEVMVRLNGVAVTAV